MTGTRLGWGIGPGQGTTQRFALLLMLFITGSVYMFNIAFRQLVDPYGYGFDCLLASGVDPNTSNPANYLNQGMPGFNDCLALHAGAWRYAWLPLAATALISLLALAHYALYPRWQRRRRGLVPLDKADPGRAVREALAGLESRAGLTTAPDYVVDLSAGSPSARVFGGPGVFPRRPGRYTVSLNAGLIALFGRDTAAFEATTLHEFAHIRNRDVGITYLTVAIWRVFLVCALVPFALTQGLAITDGLLARRPSPWLPGELPGEAGSIAMAACIVALIYLAMADVLRSREHFADLDAVGLGAEPVYWLRHVAAVPAGRDRLGPARELRAALRTHPGWEQRNAVLIRPSDMYTVRASSMFVTGMAAELLLTFMGSAPIGFGYAWIQDNSLWPAAALTTAVAGVAVWRNTAREIDAGRPPPSGLLAGAWLGVGQLAVALLFNQATGYAWFPSFPWSLVYGLLVLVPAAISWWTVGCASLWHRSASTPGARLHGTRLRDTAARAATIVVTALAFALWFGWWSALGTLYVMGNPDPDPFSSFLPGFPHTPATDVVAALTGPFVNLGYFGWGVWLTAALWIVSLIATRARGARATGAWIGCAAVASIIFLTLRAHSWTAHNGLTLDQNYTVYQAWIYGILLCSSVAAAIIVGLRGGGHPVPALAASGIASALGLAAVAITDGTDGCVGPLAVLGQRCVLANGTGWGAYSLIFELLLPALGMLTLVAAATAAGIARLATSGVAASGERRRRASADPRPPAPARPPRRPSRHRLAWAGLSAACVVLAGLSIVTYISETALSSSGQGQNVSSAPPAGSAMRALQLAAWREMGGGSIITRFEGDVSELAAQVQNGPVHGKAPEGACSAITAVVADAHKYLPPPDTLIAQSWSAAIDEASAGTRECLAGLSRNDGALATSGVLQIYNAYHAVNDISRQVNNGVCIATHPHETKCPSVSVDNGS
jgi:hypothetical protein